MSKKFNVNVYKKIVLFDMIKFIAIITCDKPCDQTLITDSQTLC